jgi:nickel-type superoxide dismutase maturation protease
VALSRWVVLGLLMAATALWWWRRRPFRVAVEGTSMAPTLLPGDFLVAVRVTASRLRRGDLVVVQHPLQPGVEMVKRLTGLPGDEVGTGGGYVLGSDEFWIAGDDPAASTDSRHFGPVSANRIGGVVRLRYWPRSASATSES